MVPVSPFVLDSQTESGNEAIEMVRAGRLHFAFSPKYFGPKSTGWMSFPSDGLSLWRGFGEFVVTRFKFQPARRFAILQYTSIASASCCFSMCSPSVCAT